MRHINKTTTADLEHTLEPASIRSLLVRKFTDYVKSANSHLSQASRFGRSPEATSAEVKRYTQDRVLHRTNSWRTNPAGSCLSTRSADTLSRNLYRRTNSAIRANIERATTHSVCGRHSIRIPLRNHAPHQHSELFYKRHGELCVGI